MNKNKIKIIYIHDETIINYELPCNINIENMMSIIYSMLIAGTFDEQNIIEAMDNFVKAHK